MNQSNRQVLKQSRIKKGLTQSQVAQYLGIKTRAYQNIEYGSTLGKIEHWDKLEDLFGIPQRTLREITTDKIVK